MPLPDDFSNYVAELLHGSYDCVDRIALRAYFRLAQTSGGFLTWWNRLFPGKATTRESLRRMAGGLAWGLAASAAFCAFLKASSDSFRSVISRAIFDAPTTRPLASLIGEIVRETCRWRPSLVVRTVSKCSKRSPRFR